MTRFVGVLAAVLLTVGLLASAYELGVRGAAGAGGLPGEFDGLVEVYERVSEGSVEAPGPTALAEGAIEGLLGTLDDDYAEYYSAEEYAAVNDQLDGRFVGIGVVLEDTQTGLTIQTVLPSSPAEEAGLEPGDQIIRVDGEDVSELPSDVVVDKVRGEAGTSVTLGVQGERGDRELVVERRELNLPNVEARLLDDDIGYVRLQQFTGEAGSEVRGAVEDLLDDGARGLVLDLRGNPGGLLPAAVDVAAVFYADGEVVKVGRDVATARVYRTDDAEAPAQDVPLAVLVDEGSASASEIVAGAVQDLERGEIVGATTYGKGTVQTISALPGGAGVKFTTNRYYTPSGDSIEGVGVTPDLAVTAGEGDDDVQLEAARAAVDEALVAGSGATN